MTNNSLPDGTAGSMLFMLQPLPGEQTSGAARAGGRASQKSKYSTFANCSFDSKGLQHRAAVARPIGGRRLRFRGSEVRFSSARKCFTTPPDNRDYRHQGQQQVATSLQERGILGTKTNRLFRRFEEETGHPGPCPVLEERNQESGGEDRLVRRRYEDRSKSRRTISTARVVNRLRKGKRYGFVKGGKSTGDRIFLRGASPS